MHGKKQKTVEEKPVVKEQDLDDSKFTTGQLIEKLGKPDKGKVYKQVLQPKKTIKTNDGGGDWEVIEKRDVKVVEKNVDTDSDEWSLNESESD